MKTILLFCLVLAEFSTFASAPKASLSGKIELPESVLPNQDIHVNLYVGINPALPRDKWGEPMQQLTVKAGKFSINAPVGNYFLTISSFNCNPYELPIVIGKDYESFSVELAPLNIPPDINTVELYLMNKGENRPKKYEMVLKGSRWLPKDSLQLEKGQQYFFILNNNNIPVYRPDKLVNFSIEKSCFQNFYNNGEIEFEPHTIPQPYVASKGQWKGNSLNPEYSKVVSDLNQWKKDYQKIFAGFLKGEITEKDPAYLAFIDGFESIQAKYSHQFPQLFIEKKLFLMDSASSIKKVLDSKDLTEKTKMIQSEEFTTYLMEYMALVDRLSPDSPFLEGGFINSLITFEQIIMNNSLTDAQKNTLGLSSDKIENLFQKFLQSESPYALANIKYILGTYYSEKGELEKGEILLNAIKSDCPYHYTITKGILDQEILGMKSN